MYALKANYYIVLTKEIMKDDVKFHRGVKKVMEMIVGLLKNGIEVADIVRRQGQKNTLKNNQQPKGYISIDVMYRGKSLEFCIYFLRVTS